MRLGVTVDNPDTVVADARQAEQLGFDLLGCGEHLFFHGPTPHGLTMLSAAAAVTSRIRLVSSITLLPLYPPALVAKMAATVDRISEGRLELGLGSGGEYPPEFAAAGGSGDSVSPDGRGPRSSAAALHRTVDDLRRQIHHVGRCSPGSTAAAVQRAARLAWGTEGTRLAPRRQVRRRVVAIHGRTSPYRRRFTRRPCRGGRLRARPGDRFCGAVRLGHSR